MLLRRRGLPLSAGLLTGTTIMCQCHGSQFDVTTGAVLRGPATDGLGTYEVHAAGREGIHYLGWFCDDYDGAVTAAEQEGRAELQRGDWSGVHFVYHEPAGGNGVVTELIELTELSREVFDLVRQEAAMWDGRDPVRSLMSEAGWGVRWDAVKAALADKLHS